MYQFRFGKWAGLTILAGLLLSAHVAHADNATSGKAVFTTNCAKCHGVGPDAKHLKGPHLNAIVGKRAASQSGYKKYSPALIAAGNSGLAWNHANLDAYLAAPGNFLRKTTMKFKGLGKPDEREAVISYLKKFTPGQDADAKLERTDDLQPDPASVPEPDQN